MTVASAHEAVTSLELTCAGCGQPIRPGEPAWSARRGRNGCAFPLAPGVETRPPPRVPRWHSRCLGGDDPAAMTQV